MANLEDDPIPVEDGEVVEVEVTEEVVTEEPAVDDASNPVRTLLSGAVYDRIKFLVQYVLPGSGTLYAALAVLWGFPNGVEVVGTIGAVTLFLGGLLGISNASYNKAVAARESQ